MAALPLNFSIGQGTARSTMKFVQIPAPDFDLAMTLKSGQVFHWEKIDNGFCGTIGDRAVHAEQVGKVIKVRGGETPQPARETRALRNIIADYFALDHPLSEICASFANQSGSVSRHSFVRR